MHITLKMPEAMTHTQPWDCPKLAGHQQASATSQTRLETRTEVSQSTTSHWHLSLHKLQQHRGCEMSSHSYYSPSSGRWKIVQCFKAQFPSLDWLGHHTPNYCLFYTTLQDRSGNCASCFILTLFLWQSALLNTEHFTILKIHFYITNCSLL